MVAFVLSTVQIHRSQYDLSFETVNLSVQPGLFRQYLQCFRSVNLSTSFKCIANLKCIATGAAVVRFEIRGDSRLDLNEYGRKFESRVG